MPRCGQPIHPVTQRNGDFRAGLVGGLASGEPAASPAGRRTVRCVIATDHRADGRAARRSYCLGAHLRPLLTFLAFTLADHGVAYWQKPAILQ